MKKELENLISDFKRTVDKYAPEPTQQKIIKKAFEYGPSALLGMVVGIVLPGGPLVWGGAGICYKLYRNHKKNQ